MPPTRIEFDKAAERLLGRPGVPVSAQTVEMARAMILYGKTPVEMARTYGVTHQRACAVRDRFLGEIQSDERALLISKVKALLQADNRHTDKFRKAVLSALAAVVKQ